MKILHVITGLDVGGAETMLYKLVTTSSLDMEVISLTTAGVMAERLRAKGVPVRALGLRAATAPIDFIRLVRWIRASRADVVQTWMYHSDLFGGAAARLAGRAPVVWNVRASRLDVPGVKRSTIAVVKMCARASHRIPARIVCCSHASAKVHEEIGYAAGKLVVIPNGFDLEALRPDLDARRSIRAELGLPAETPLVGLVARFDALKGHDTFLRAAARVAEAHADVHFVLAGGGVTSDNAELMQSVEPVLNGRVHLLGYRSDIARINASLDVATCSSSTEGFPNVVGEAMASGVPCVVTNVGESEAIVGDTGIVVPPNDPAGLAAGILEILRSSAEDRQSLGARARARICSEFALPEVVRRYEDLYSRVAEGDR